MCNYDVFTTVSSVTHSVGFAWFRDFYVVSDAFEF